MFGGNFAPYQWAFCSGQILPIQQYAALFSLLGVNFGGNGTSNFGLPNMQGMGPICPGPGGGGIEQQNYWGVWGYRHRCFEPERAGRPYPRGNRSDRHSFGNVACGLGLDRGQKRAPVVPILL
jgi:hypothetical protein